MTRTFRGGAHPPEHKEATEGKAIFSFLEPKQVVIPLSQHLGAPIVSLVKVGDLVTKGQKIADSDGKLACPVHASICGVVKKIEHRAQTNNTEGLAIIIDADGRSETAYMQPLDAFSCTKEEALARIREAGIVGMGGAGFPTYVKLAPPPNKKIDVVIANAAECEPFLTIDEAIMTEYADAFVGGLAISMKVVGVEKGVIALEDNKKHLVKILEKAIADSGFEKKIRVQLLQTKYPQGAEKMIITVITGKEVPSGGLPMDVGVVVQNVSTLKAIYDAFKEGKPLIERGLTVSGGAIENTRNMILPIGTVIEDLIPSVIELDHDDVRQYLAGGPMMGTSIPHLKVSVQKNTSGILALSEKEAKLYSEGSCIRCGRCMRACSCRLSPQCINEALKARNFDQAEEIGVMDCVECGTCSFVCPAHIQLVQRFRVGKQLIRAKKMKESK